MGVSASLLGYFGISGLLFAIELFHMPEEQLAIYTSLFYGVIFFFAFSGFRAETRRHRMLMTKKLYEEVPSAPIRTKARAQMARVRRCIWVLFSVVSLGWITPALVIYWMEPLHVARMVVVSASLVGVAAGIFFVRRKIENVKTTYDLFRFFVGLCIGIYLANSLGIGIWP